MSEPSSLYARFSMSHEQYEAFMTSTPASPRFFVDWQNWFDHQGVPEPVLAEGGVLSDLPESTVADCIKAWREDEWTGTPPIEYDEMSRTLRIAMLRTSENYHEMLRILTPLRGACAFNVEDADDFVLIFDYLWGDDTVNAYVRFRDGRSRFEHELDEEHRAEAEAYLDDAVNYIQSKGRI